MLNRHASTPHQGAGAGMAIEDALVLSRLLALVKDKKHIPAAFRAYDQLRRPRTQKLVTTSRDAGRLYDMQMPGVGEDVEKIKSNLAERWKWIWDFDLEEHVEEAKTAFRKEVEA